jgi:hypothetical protein
MDYRTIVKNEDWKEFAEELFDKTRLRFEDADELIDFNPFDSGAYWHHCALDMDEDAGVLNLANNIDDEVELLSNDEFIELCSVKFPKNGVALGEIGCFVEKQLWNVFVDMLQEFTSVRWVEGQKPKEFVPSLDAGYVFVSLGLVESDVGLYTQKPDFVGSVVTKVEFIHQCCKQFTKD